MNEPILTLEDRRRWKQLERTVAIWKRGNAYRRRVDTARSRILEVVHEFDIGLEVAWSGGKDSTAMVALISEVCQREGMNPTPARSIKDDLDFPGEEEYVLSVAKYLNVSVMIIHPPFSLLQWITDHAHEMIPGDDIHGRAAELSKKGFYNLIEEHRLKTGIKAVFLGLRSEESHPRAMNRALRGWRYTKKDGETVIQPICDWTGLDVYAYLSEREIEPLPMYRCVRFHKEPWRVRKSWWLPGAAASRGQTAWLKAYYPSLYNKLCEAWPMSGVMA